MNQPLRTALVFVIVIGFAAAGAAAAGIKVPFLTDPEWTSADTGVATGCAFGDLDKDGWPDLVVANGNDIYRERVQVYYNQGNGTYPVWPDWTSSDIDYHGHVALGDVNGDGWLDAAVSVFLGPGGFNEKGHAKLYLNNGSGTLLSNPSWQSEDLFYTFSLALGDADGDGDLDLAVAVGESYYHSPDKNRIYFNNGGALDTLPGWMSTEIDHSFDAAFSDFNGDGRLDLAFCNSKSVSRIYYGTGSGISQTAGWSAASPAAANGNSIAVGDVNLDGAPDIVFSDNSQLGGTGRFIAYFSNGSGGHSTTPSWQSEYVGYTSAVALIDIEGDGDLDVLGGSWWGDVRVYRNDAGTLAAASDFTTDTYSVVEALPLGDADRAGLRPVNGELHAGDGSRKAFLLEKTPVLSVELVYADGAPVPPSAYCFDSEAGWLSLAQAPQSALSVSYTTTVSPDFAVSNWDDDKGNYLFLHRDMTVTLTPPDDPVIQAGTLLPVTGTVANYTSDVEHVYLISAVRLPGGLLYGMGAVWTWFPAYLLFTGSKDFPVPSYAPLGNYEFLYFIWDGVQVADKDSFPFTVIG